MAPTAVHLSLDLPPWTPVPKEEVIELISTLKTGKVTGPDGILCEFLINNPSWWAEPLANLFMLIDQIGILPDSWLSSILVPIFKKGEPAFPGNYRPISLLSSIGKLYARHLLKRLTDWAQENRLPGREQISFHPGSSTLDHELLLSFFAEKYSTYFKGKLCVAFIDLRGAFDSVNRELLWNKLASWGVDLRLLFLIRKLHSSNYCQVWTNQSGSLSDKIPVTKGVRQGCILAPLLFNLFLADLRPHLTSL